LRLLLNNFELHLDVSPVYSVSLWLNDLFQGSQHSIPSDESSLLCAPAG